MKARWKLIAPTAALSIAAGTDVPAGGGATGHPQRLVVRSWGTHPFRRRFIMLIK